MSKTTSMTSDKPGYLFHFLYFNLNETKKSYEQSRRVHVAVNKKTSIK